MGIFSICKTIYSRPLCTQTFQRLLLSTSATQGTAARKAWLFVDSVFPIRVARWDLRHYIGLFREEYLLADLRARLESVKAHNFTVLSLESYQKDGGVFVQFSYNDNNDPETALKAINTELTEEVQKHGSLPSWRGFGGGQIWLVKGTPWVEDMSRFASPILQVAFEGPDVHEQLLYALFRPYGHIQNLTLPLPVPTGTLRSSTITFNRVRSATIARNVLYGLTVSSSSSGSPLEDRTRLRTTYQRPVQAHAVRAWVSGHPKIMLPLFAFILGILTYTVFDPFRSLMVKGKMLDSFNFREFKIYKWFRVNALDRFSATSGVTSSPVAFQSEEGWRDRDEAVRAIKTYLADFPNSIAYIHGPRGSGKTEMLDAILKESGRTVLRIDCQELQKASSDTQMVVSLARQTGYWPVFTFLTSVDNLIDLVSVGLIGQKVGSSNSLSDQLRQILTVVGTALNSVNFSHRANMKQKIKNNENRLIKDEAEAQKRIKVMRGTWHDGRLDCVSGNGIMSELGIGDERMTEGDGLPVPMGYRFGNGDGEEIVRKQRTKEEMEAAGALPVVLIRNYTTKMGSRREEFLTVLAQWAAMLTENQIAHVIVLSDNRENSKLLAKALPSKALTSVALSDADPRGSISFVKQKLRDAGIQADLTAEQTVYIERLGGRASDLESLIRKVRNGYYVEEAVEDIINRGVEELRKIAFGDDVDDAKNLPWTREQAWAVSRLISEHGEVPYHDVLMTFPFEGDGTSLRNMEHAELISIGTKDGRASTIRPGRPVLRWVFERLVNDPIFRATQDIAFNKKVIMNSEKTVRDSEGELIEIEKIMSLEAGSWWALGFGRKSAISLRAKYLTDKMLGAQKKIEILERRNRELKKVLAKKG